ncbi:tetratricopeptide repeat protein [Fischerella sp. PCC 9605]|uniref:tetratricopeptide repeat protein n=1 Tax=Fischerella sp. PCC 9605 TaxID=1173024 RepID=UPI0006890DD9|nr:tetratricopeptide repeat protein [Fischerella sp. PCC 9605]
MQSKISRKPQTFILKKARKLMVYISQGLVRATLKDYQGAIAAYNQSIKLNPTAEAYYHRAEIRMILGDGDGSLADQVEAIASLGKYSQGWTGMIRKAAEGFSKLQ